MTKISFDVKFLCCYKLLQLTNTATTIKLIKLPQQINDHFDINDDGESFAPVLFLMFKVGLSPLRKFLPN